MDIKINYRCIDKKHVFTSDNLKGLYVASDDFQKAYDALPEIIRELMRINHPSFMY